MTLRVGIDVRKIRDGGIGRHLEGLLSALAQRPDDASFVLFGQERELPAALRATLEAGSFRFVTCDAGLYSWSELFAFRGAARRHDLNIMHFPHYVRSLDPGCPVAVTIHDCIHLSHPPSLAAGIYAKAMLHWSARSAAALFAPSEAARQDIAARLGIAVARIRVAPNGVDARFAPPSEEARAAFRRARKLDREFVLCVGTHRPHKNVAAAIEGFRRAALPETELVLATASERDAARLRPVVASRARILAGVDDRELPCLYASARIVLAPSLAEGFGLGPLEAASCGAAVLASSIAAHREVLSDAAAWIAAPAGPAEIGAALSALWWDEDRRDGLRRHAVALARRFPWSRCADAMLDGWRASLR